jgi:hypothetical protein
MSATSPALAAVLELPASIVLAKRYSVGDGALSLEMKKTCPRCRNEVGVRSSRCRSCGYDFPEGRGPRPAGLAMGVGFPLFLMGTLILFFSHGGPLVMAAVAGAMVLIGVTLFFDPR